MGIYHGCKFVAVTAPEAGKCFVKRVDVRPTGEHGCFRHEPTYVAIPECLRQYPVVDDMADAMKLVKEHIFSITINPIVERVVCIEHLKLDMEKERALGDKSEISKKRITDWKEIIDTVSKEVKQLKIFRKRKVLVE